MDKKNGWLIGQYTIDARKIVGKGGFGIVFKATNQRNEVVAGKRIDLKSKDRTKVERITRDLDKVLKLNHPNIVSMFEIHQETQIVWMFMEYCAFGDLNDFYREENENLNEDQLLDLMLQIAQGVEYLHSKNTIHRDIKPPNILVAGQSPLLAKLADFDLSKFLEENCDTSNMTSNVGTPAFKAPEFFMCDDQRAISYHRNVDTFAVGLIYLAILQADPETKQLVPRMDISDRVTPIGQIIATRMRNNEKQLDVVKLDGNGQKFGRFIKTELKKLIQKMTSADPKQRPTASQVLHDLQQIASRKTDGYQSGNDVKSQQTPQSNQSERKPVFVEFNKTRMIPGIKLIRTQEWKTGLCKVTMCVNSRDQVILRGQKTWSFKREEQRIRILDHKTGNVLANMTSECRHSFCPIAEDPLDPNSVLEACKQCDVIRSYITKTQRKTVYEHCKPHDICKGPENSLLVLTDTDNILQFVWRRDLGELELVHGTDATVKDVQGKCYIEQHQSLVTCNSSRVKAMNPTNGAVLWEFSKDVAGKKLSLHGLCSDANGRVYVTDGSNERLLILDGRTGRLLQDIKRDWKNGIRDVWWISQQKLLVRYGHPEGYINVYSVREA